MPYTPKKFARSRELTCDLRKQRAWMHRRTAAEFVADIVTKRCNVWMLGWKIQAVAVFIGVVHGARLCALDNGLHGNGRGDASALGDEGGRGCDATSMRWAPPFDLRLLAQHELGSPCSWPHAPLPAKSPPVVGPPRNGVLAMKGTPRQGLWKHKRGLVAQHLRTGHVGYRDVRGGLCMGPHCTLLGLHDAQI